jgi:O-antigen ligase
LKAKANPLGVSAGGPSRRFRVSGFTRHFLTYAEQMQVFALLAFGALVASLRRALASPSAPPLSLSLLLFLLFSLALVLTASRAVIAAFLISLLAVSALLANRRVALVALIAALALGGGGVYALRATRTTGAVEFSDDSAARRVGYMRAGLKLIPRRPLLGVGMDAHKRHWKEWGFPGEYVTHTHSTPIQIAMERGLPTLSLYLWLMAAMGVAVWRGYRRARAERGEFEWLALGTFAALVGFAASSLVNYNFGDSEVIMLLFSLVGAVLAAERNPENITDVVVR